MAHPKESISPERFAALVWKPGKTDFVRQLRECGISPFQLTLIDMIKQTGKEVLGIASGIADATDRQWRNRHVTLDDVADAFPVLGNAMRNGLHSAQETAEGLTSIHFSGDTIGLVDATCLLPEKLSLAPLTDEPVALPYGSRVPVADMKYKPINIAPEEGARHVLESSPLWNKLACYLRLARGNPRVFSYSDFMKLAQRNGSAITPFSFSETAADFWIMDPLILTDGGQELCGKICIQAAAVLQGASGPPKNYPARTIVAFNVGRTWSRHSKETVDGMRHALAESMAAGYQRDQDLIRNPVNAGRMSGK